MTTDTRSSSETADVRVYIKNPTLTLKKNTLDGTDTISGFDFLARFVKEADMLNMLEAQEFIDLPTSFTEPA